MAFFWLTSGTVTAGGVHPREVLGTGGAWGRTSPECPPCWCHLPLHPSGEWTQQEQRAEGWAGVMMTNLFLDKLNLRHLRRPRGKRMI